jgi:hypothetical protein
MTINCAGDCQHGAAIRLHVPIAAPGLASSTLSGRCAAFSFGMPSLSNKMIALVIALTLVACVAAKVLTAPPQTHVMVDCRGAGRC